MIKHKIEKMKDKIYNEATKRKIKVRIWTSLSTYIVSYFFAWNYEGKELVSPISISCIIFLIIFQGALEELIVNPKGSKSDMTSIILKRILIVFGVVVFVRCIWTIGMKLGIDLTWLLGM